MYECLKGLERFDTLPDYEPQAAQDPTDHFVKMLAGFSFLTEERISAEPLKSVQKRRPTMAEDVLKSNNRPDRSPSGGRLMQTRRKAR